MNEDSGILQKFLDNAWEQVMSEVLEAGWSGCGPIVFRLIKETGEVTYLPG